MARNKLAIRSLQRSSAILPSSTHSSRSSSYHRRFSTSPLQNELATIETQQQQQPTPEASLLSSSPPPPSEPISPSTHNPLSPPLPPGPRRLRFLQRTQSSPGIPFSQLPYQCFQEARKILEQDRAEKLLEIETQRGRIARLKETDASVSGGEFRKRNRIFSMQRYLEELKVKADVNDPMVRKRFEDGEGDMNKPIYRYLSHRKWRSYRRPILMQRITQMFVIPDVLSSIDPIVDITLSFNGRSIQPGDFVQSTRSEKPPKLKAQLFEQGSKLVTIAVVDSDVPNVQTDGFDTRCHFLACNVEITPTTPWVDLAKLRSVESDGSSQQAETTTTTTSASTEDKPAASPTTEEAQAKQSTGSSPEKQPPASNPPNHPPPAQPPTPPSPSPSPSPLLLHPYLPPTSHPGAPPHRLTLLLLHQKDNTPISTNRIPRRSGFKIRSFAAIHKLNAIGVHMFRVRWDEGMDGVMERMGLGEGEGERGWEFKRRKVEPGVYKRRNPSTFR
ncbi:MAG: hypothetical protein Q9160_003471 [Pyrenula sp. 1 TL-2023]